MNQMIGSLSECAAPVAEGPQHFGLIRIGTAMLAIDVDHVREVIPAPPAMFTAAIVAEGLCGMIELRGAVIPVADLRSTLGLPVTDAFGSVVLVLRVKGRLIGLLADEVCGLAVANAEDLHTLSIAKSTDGTALATHSFRWGGTIVTLLDAYRIIDLPGMPSIRESVVKNGLAAMANAEPQLLFTVAGLFLGVAADAVEATAPSAEILQSPYQSDICIGKINHHSLEVPVVDTLRVLGLSKGSAAAKTSSVLVLRYGNGHLLGFVLDGVCDIPRLNPDQILPIPNAFSRRTNLLRGVYTDQRSNQFLVLDPAALRTEKDLCMLASLSRAKVDKNEGANPLKASGSDGFRPYLIYRAGADLASPLTDISEILNYPKNVMPLADNADGLLGLFTHRGMAISLLCLATQLGHSAVIDPKSARVLLIPDGDQTVGIVVESLKSIELARTRQGRGDTAANASRFMGFDMAEFRIDDQIRLLPHINLAQVFS